MSAPLLRCFPVRLLATAGLGVLLIAVGPGPAAAQGPFAVGIGGGLTVPHDRLDASTERGFHGMASVRLGIPLVPVHLRVDGLAARLGGIGGASDLDVAAATVNVGYDLLPLPVAAVYVVGGAGYYWTKRSDAGAARVRNDGWNAGAGLRLSLGGVRLFGEARYHTVRTDEGGTNFMPVTVGVIF